MSKTVTKAELIAEIAKQSGMSKSSISDVLLELENTAKRALQNGDAIIIPGLVKLTPKDRAERTARNPATGEPVLVPAKRVVVAKAVSTILN